MTQAQFWRRRIYYRDGQIYTREPGTGRIRHIADLAIGDDTDRIGIELTGVWNNIIRINPDDPVGTAQACLRDHRDNDRADC